MSRTNRRFFRCTLNTSLSEHPWHAWAIKATTTCINVYNCIIGNNIISNALSLTVLIYNNNLIFAVFFPTRPRKTKLPSI